MFILKIDTKRENVFFSFIFFHFFCSFRLFVYVFPFFLNPMIFEIFNKMKKIFVKRVHSFLENIYSCKKFSSFLQKFASIVDDFAITYRSKILLSQPHFYLLLFSLSLSSFCVSLVSLLHSYLPFFFFFPILFFPPSIRSTFEILNPVATPRGKDVECQRRVFDDEERKFSSFWNRGNDRNRGDLFSSWRDGFRRQTSNYSLCREKEKQRDLDFLFLRALLDMADRVRVSPSLEDTRR